MNQKIEIDGKAQPHIVHRLTGPDHAIPVKFIVSTIIAARIDHVHIDIPQAVAAQVSLAIDLAVVFLFAFCWFR